MSNEVKISTNAAKWSLLLVWSNRFLGLISTLVLVKYLTPYDFGVAVTAVMVQGLAQSFTEIGYRNYIIKNNLRDNLSISSAWTLSLILKSSSALIILGFALVSRFFYGEIDISNVLIVSSVIPILTALINPGLVLDEMDDNYKNISLIPIYTKLITVPVTIALAVLYHSFWSVVIAGLIGAIINVLLSYAINRFRPILTLHDVSNQISFSKNIFVYSILGFMRSRLENFSVLYLFGVKGNGSYSVTQEFAYLPLTEIAQPLARGFYASASALKSNEERTLLLAKYVNIGLLILVPCFLGSLAISDIFTAVVLGPNWMHVSSLISVFCLISIQFFVLSLISNIFVINEKFKYIYLIDIANIVSLGLATVCVTFPDIINFTIVRSVLAYLVFAISMYFLHKLVAEKCFLIFKSLPYLVVSSLLMYFAVVFLMTQFGIKEYNDFDLMKLIGLILSGFVVYAFLLYFLSKSLASKNSQMNDIYLIFVGFYNFVTDRFIKKI